MDPVLDPYLRATGDEAERCLAALLGGDTDRTIRAIVARTLCGPSASRRAYALETDDPELTLEQDSLGIPVTSHFDWGLGTV